MYTNESDVSLAHSCRTFVRLTFNLPNSNHPNHSVYKFHAFTEAYVEFVSTNMLEGDQPSKHGELEDHGCRDIMLVGAPFSSQFFDVMTHLPIHIVKELAMCGQVHARWCYGVERYMGVLAQYVRNRATLEASMASRYGIKKRLAFARNILTCIRIPLAGFGTRKKNYPTRENC